VRPFEQETAGRLRIGKRTVKAGSLGESVSNRTDLVGIFPNDRALIRLAASVVIEQNDEWLVGHRYLSAHSLNAILTDDNKDTRKETRELTAA
jgi:Transposase, Mutator family